MATVVLSVPDISCEHCERTIRGALAPIQGIRHLDVNITARQVRVTYDETQIAIGRMKEILQRAGYPVASLADGGER